MTTRAVLIVEDDARVCRATVRLLQRRFETILTADTPKSATQILTEGNVSHLVCDYDLGKGLPTAVDLIPGWRAQYPSVERAVIFTGRHFGKVPSSVDAVVFKAADSEDLLRALEVTE